jgi:hypothetical protein
MTLLKGVFTICLLLFLTTIASAQTAGSTGHADTSHHISSFTPNTPDTLAIDTSIIIPDSGRHVYNDTIQKKPVSEGYAIYGKIEDINTGEGIPFATAYFPRTSAGIAADLDGNFILKFDQLPGDTLHIDAVGYVSVNKILRKGQHNFNYIVELSRSKTELTGFTFHAGEDPAVLLMRQIISHKPINNPDKADNYKYEAYNKLEADLQRLTKSQFEKIPILKSYSFIFNNVDSTSDEKPYLPLYLTETLSDYYYRRDPKKQREFIKASMVRGVKNENMNKYLGSLYQNINVYRNYLPVFDKKFVSPISNDGLYYYKYTIKDTQKAYGHNIILVQFRPKRAGENCFTGDFWVVDSIYAIQRVSMDVSKEANLNWVDAVSLYQEFAPVDSFWFCIKDKFIANFSAYNSKKLPGMIGRKTTTYHNIVINSPSVTRVLDDPQWKEDVITPDSSKGKTDDWWRTHRPDSLSKSEKAVYKMVDTITSMPITTFYKNMITILASGVKDIGPLQLGPYFYVYSHNPVEGDRFRLSLGTPRSIKDAKITGFLAYGDKDNRFKYGLTGLWILQRDPRMYLYGYYVHDIDQSSNYYDQLGSDNIFSTLFRKPGIPWKLAFSDDYRFEFYKQYHNRFSHKLILQHRDYSPYSPLPSAGIFQDYNGSPTTHVVSTEIGVELRYAYKEKYLDGQYLRYNIGSKYPVVTLEATAGIKNLLGSDYQYQKARCSITESINIPPLGHLYYNVFAGKYFGTLPYPLLEIHPGNEYYYYNQYAFEMMNTYEFISDQYAGFNIEHNIGGGIFNHIPGVKKLKFRQFWTAKGVIGSVSNDNYNLNFNKGYPFRSLQGNPYLELGTGVSNIFQIFRIDFVWRVSPMPSSEEARSRYFGIFGSVRFQF